MRMTKDSIRLCIKRKELYDNPELNERLYLHHKGFTEIRNLENFTHLESLFLEANALTKIENIVNKRHLQSLYLQNNKLERIENLPIALKYLNVSNNLISKIDNLSTLQSLESLIVKQNKLSKPDSIRNVIYMQRLRELDLSMNKINCSPESILEILAQCKSLKILRLKGNPMAKSTKHYRKLVISRCPKLINLDGNPICKEERRRCDSWGKVVMNGGSFDEANEADIVELNIIRSEQSEANALKRELHGSDDGSTCSNASKTIGASVIEGIKKTFGLIDTTRTPSSTISWSSKHLSHDDAEELSKRVSMKKELDQVRGIVVSQRKEIINLKKSLDQSTEAAELQQHIESSIHGMWNIDDDSEKDTSYSIVKDQELAQQAGLKEMQQAVAEQQWEGYKSQMNREKHSPSAAAESNSSSSVAVQKPNNRSSMASTGIHDFDPFSIFPPAPPPRNASM